MVLSASDQQLLAAVQDGLPLTPRPYAAIGAKIGLCEDEVIAGLRRLIDDGVIKRFGVIVRHHELGYRANAMVVFDIPDEKVRAAGERLATLPFVTLCYRRPRRPPLWPYNLFCMIHGQDRAVVLEQIAQASAAAGLDGVARAVLFSARRFKQQGARYGLPARSEAA
jgi:DNA-binding Lrp family transcriptional regulator